MENDVKRCLYCGKQIPEDRKAVYCDNKCSTYAYYQRHNPRKVLADACLCYFNREVLCSYRECERCGWNPVVAQRRLDEFLIEEVEDDG